MANQGTGAGGSLGGSGFATVGPSWSSCLGYSRGEENALREKGCQGRMRSWQERFRRVTAGDSSKLIIREASEGKRKGKEDICSAHQCLVCNAIARNKAQETTMK